MVALNSRVTRIKFSPLFFLQLFTDILSGKGTALQSLILLNFDCNDVIKIKVHKLAKGLCIQGTYEFYQH